LNRSRHVIADRLMSPPEAFPPGFDRADWKKPPHTAWALRNVALFLPVAPVATGPASLPTVRRSPI
jgi:hypothetical protein